MFVVGLLCSILVRYLNRSPVIVHYYFGGFKGTILLWVLGSFTGFAVLYSIGNLASIGRYKIISNHFSIP